MPSQCQMTIPAGLGAEIFMLGTRDVAEPLRARVEAALETSANPICIDFGGLLASQSFMDEFLGVMILRHGPSIFDRILFRNCNDDVQAAIRFVAAIRGREYEAQRAGSSTSLS